VSDPGDAGLATIGDNGGGFVGCRAVVPRGKWKYFGLHGKSTVDTCARA